MSNQLPSNIPTKASIVVPTDLTKAEKKANSCIGWMTSQARNKVSNPWKMVICQWMVLLLLPCAAFIHPTLPYSRLKPRFQLHTQTKLAAKPQLSFPPSLEEYKKVQAESIKNIDKYWDNQAKACLTWQKAYTKVRDGTLKDGNVVWFPDGELNMCYNCLDRHLPTKANKIAMIWEGDKPEEDIKYMTYKELHAEVCRLANAMVDYGIVKGDIVTIYMHTAPELAMVMLACARIGAIHDVVFTGHSPLALRERLLDTKSKWLFTLDEMRRSGSRTFLKHYADRSMIRIDEEILKLAPEGFVHVNDNVEKVFVFRRTSERMPFDRETDILINEQLFKYKDTHDYASMKADDPLFMLYPPGTRGSNRGVVHTTGGYAVHVASTMKQVYDIQEDAVVGCMVDTGFIAGHSYSVYGPLLQGATTFLFGSAPGYPTHMRYWDMVKRHNITHIISTPTAFRTMMKEDPVQLRKRVRPSLRVIGTVGETLDDKTWTWLNDVVGKGKCTIVNSHVQLETGAATTNPIATTAGSKNATCGMPCLGIDLAILDENGTEITDTVAQGLLVAKQPWPGMPKTIHANDTKFLEKYIHPRPGYFYLGEGCKRDEDGCIRVTGRVEDFINHGGYLINCVDADDAILSCDAISDVATVGVPHDTIGEGICAFVVLNKDYEMDRKQFMMEVKQSVRTIIGLFATPDDVQFISGIPRTAEGHAVRHILSRLAAGEAEDLGDTSMVADAALMAKIIKQAKKATIHAKGTKTKRQLKQSAKQQVQRQKQKQKRAQKQK